ncbi:hypothetical protein I7I50_01798 [Histoplasma capsulatum G186AR]|uniref:Uncharacterized protein n=1 Tax=Ajellomyces capsulatus TaxID=5037 RepID=A0A8H7YEK0_AJECA|nr:hypothetical protein I7I52_12012 [Histoplasma capsulatum]QSS71078.1 hypothetical protein I7I50_01798 [Histoplasma capsulatum G186AR]
MPATAKSAEIYSTWGIHFHAAGSCTTKIGVDRMISLAKLCLRMCDPAEKARSSGSEQGCQHINQTTSIAHDMMQQVDLSATSCVSSLRWKLLLCLVWHGVMNHS